MTRDKELILIFAFRYALGRRSYAPSVVVEELKSRWKKMRDNDKVLIKGEIREAIDKGRAGDRMDILTWNEILALEE